MTFKLLFKKRKIKKIIFELYFIRASKCVQTVNVNILVGWREYVMYDYMSNLSFEVAPRFISDDAWILFSSTLVGLDLYFDLMTCVGTLRNPILTTTFLCFVTHLILLCSPLSLPIPSIIIRFLYYYLHECFYILRHA